MIELDHPDQLDLAALIRPGDALVCSQALGEPVSLTRRLIEQRREIGPVSLCIGPTLAETFTPEHGDFIRFRSYCGTARNALLSAGGVLDPVPSSYGEHARLFASGIMRSDVVLLTLGEPDAAGRFNLGLGNDYVVDAARRARLVIAEVAERLPWVHGANLPGDIRPHILLRAGREPLTMEDRAADAGAVEQAIARHVAALVPDGATLAIGAGGLPNLVLQALSGHANLGIHSGSIGDGMIDLMESGVVTNATKPFGRGRSVAGLLMGSRRLLDYVHRNPRVRLEPPSRTHDLAILSRTPRFVFVMGAIEVDLTGQVNAESAGGRYIGAVGGQPDFLRGANLSPGGCSIVMLSSTARGGSASRIVPRLPDRVVSTPRGDVQYVVTEHGVADLRGKSLRQRMEAMVALAHPDFRAELDREAGLLALKPV